MHKNPLHPKARFLPIAAYQKTNRGDTLGWWKNTFRLDHDMVVGGEAGSPFFAILKQISPITFFSWKVPLDAYNKFWRWFASKNVERRDSSDELHQPDPLDLFDGFVSLTRMCLWLFTHNGTGDSGSRWYYSLDQSSSFKTSNEGLRGFLPPEGSTIMWLVVFALTLQWRRNRIPCFTAHPVRLSDKPYRPLQTCQKEFHLSSWPATFPLFCYSHSMFTDSSFTGPTV